MAVACISYICLVQMVIFQFPPILLSLLAEIFCKSVLFLLQSVYSVTFYSLSGLMDTYLALRLIILYCQYLFCSSNCSNFGHWELFHIGFLFPTDMSPSLFEHFIVFCHHKMFQTYLVFSLM